MMDQTIAALFVATKGNYSGIPYVECWDETRDARLYAGPYPVVAHPPCSRWCKLAGLVEHRYGLKQGDDGGCFETALAAVRRWGGVLEHPAFSTAWQAYGLIPPLRGGGWYPADSEGGWSCRVDQGNYGHPARKSTWLYANGIVLPILRWERRKKANALVSFCQNKIGKHDTRPRLTKKQASATPAEFRDILIQMARSHYIITTLQGITMNEPTFPQPLTGIQRALMALTSMTHQYHHHPEVRAWAEKVWTEGNQTTATFKQGKVTLALTKEAMMHNCLLALRKAMPSCSSDTHKETLMAPWVALQQSEVDIESWVVLFVCGLLHLPYKASVQIVCNGKGGDLHVRVQMGWYLYEIRPQIPEVQVEDAFSAPINF